MPFGLLLLSSCDDDTEYSPQEEMKVTEVEDDVQPPLEGPIDAAEEDFIYSLNFHQDDATLKSFVFPDGSVEDRYFLDGDISMEIREYEKLHKRGQIETRQYRTYNLVNAPQTINVIGYTGGGGYGLTNKMATALQWAINNYNALNTGLNFTLTYGTNYGPYDIVVYRIPNGQAGGVAGFPSNGNPYKWVQIFSGTDAYNTNVVEHVITHEIGHCLGLRHTDWETRASCGQSGESANPDGAVYIPGTPTGYDANSIMLACFGTSEDGEFGYYDRVALETLY